MENNYTPEPFFQGELQAVQLIASANAETKCTGSFSLVAYKAHTKEFQNLRCENFFFF